jgi:hypothetical protein
MKNNKLIVYKKSIFRKISEFFKKIFSKKEVLSKEVIITNEKNNNFLENIQIKEDKEELRLLQLKQQYENGEIDEEEISDEDVDKLCELYKKETDELNADTERRKNYIAQMLKELKNA